MAVSKKTRFEVFKRDAFTCQYCGRTPPQVVLELDHVIPKYRKGKEQIENYITACFDCNRGKGKRQLTELPPAIKDKLPKFRETYEQLKAYNEYLKGEDVFYDKSLSRIKKTFNEEYPDYHLTLSPNTIRYFLKQLPARQVEDAMMKACGAMQRPPDTIRYFCGICWKAIIKDR
jgi:hypothetical protein